MSKIRTAFRCWYEYGFRDARATLLTVSGIATTLIVTLGLATAIAVLFQ